MFCENCGNKIKENDKFCENCGEATNKESLKKYIVEKQNLKIDESKEREYLENNTNIENDLKFKKNNNKNNKLNSIFIGLLILVLLLGNIFIFKNIIFDNTKSNVTKQNDKQEESTDKENNLNEDNKTSDNSNINIDDNKDNTTSINNDEEEKDEINEKTYKHNYKLIQSNMNWEEAKEYCESLGGHLATITTSEEEKEVLNLLENSEIRVLWLGANDLNSLGNFEWINGEEFTYYNWAPNEPNNDKGVEHYLVLYKVDGNWLWNDGPLNTNDYYKSENIGFVCEWEVEE